MSGEKISLPARFCISYCFGTVGVSILLSATTTFFPTLMATMLGRSAALAGLLLTLWKLYDIVATSPSACTGNLQADRRTEGGYGV